MNRRANLRASDEDRERTIERLHRASTEGRIAAEELEQRVSRALKARTYGDLDATVSDLPQSGRGRGREPARRSGAAWSLSVVRANPILLVLAIPALAATAAVLLAASIVWAVLMIVVMVLGGRPPVPRAPWGYARRYPSRLPRRGPGGYRA